MEPVLPALIQLIQLDPEVELLNFYKSYPVSVHAVLNGLDAQGGATLRVSPPGSVCLYQNKTTILLSNALSDAVRAKVLAFDIAEGILTLGSFSYMGPWTGRRMLVRVQPDQPIPVILQKDDMIIRGTVLDISLNGVGILVTNMMVNKNDSFQVKISLPSGDIDLPGYVISVMSQSGTNRISIKFLSSSRSIALILKYLTSRRIEIQSEVEALYQKVLMTARA